MLKGVNKRIIEINQTQNDYIEKAILILNSDKVNLPKEYLDSRAAEYLNSLFPDKPPPRRRPIRLIAAIIGAAAGIILLICLWRL